MPKISALPAGGTVTGAELIPAVQGGVTVKLSLAGALALKADVASPTFTGAVTINSAGGSALAVGPNGATNPTFLVTDNVVSQATGLQLTGQAVGNGVYLSAISPSADEGLNISAKGAAAINLGALSTGTIIVSNALTYGGVTLSNSVTGTGGMVLSSSPTLVTPALGTPSAIVLTSGTGLPILTGVSGLGAGVAAFLATPSSANLRSAITDESGTGALIFAGGALGAATATSINGLTITTTTGTFTLTNAKTFAVTNSITISGTDATVMTFPTTTATIARTDAAQTFTGVQTFSSTIGGSINGNAATVTTNANLTGVITSAGNATSIASQTGTGTKFVVDASPALTGTPTAPTAALNTNTTQIATMAAIANSQGPDLLASGSFPAAATLSVINIPANYAYIQIMWLGASCDTAARMLQIRLSTNNGSSYDSTVGNYPGFTTSGGTTLGSKAAATIIPEITLSLAADTNKGSVFLTNVAGTWKQYQASGQYPGVAETFCIGRYEVTSIVNALQFLWNGAGNFDAGTYAVYGVR